MKEFQKSDLQRIAIASDAFNKDAQLEVGIFQFKRIRELKSKGLKRGVHYRLVIRKHIVEDVFKWILDNWDWLYPLIFSIKRDSPKWTN